MLLDTETRRQDVTANAVTLTLTLDVETCITLSHAFKDLAEALWRAQRAYNGAKRWKDDEPYRLARQNELKAAITRRLEGLKDLPSRKAASVIGKEFEIGYDAADLWVSEIRREERHRAALERDRKIGGLSKNGLSAKAIGERLGLSPGTVKNILSRIRGPVRKAVLKSTRQETSGRDDTSRDAAFGLEASQPRISATSRLLSRST